MFNGNISVSEFNALKPELIVRNFDIKTRQAYKNGIPYGIHAKVLDSFGNKVASVSGGGFDMLGYLIAETLVSIFRTELLQKLEVLKLNDKESADFAEKILLSKEICMLGNSLEQVLLSAKHLGFNILIEKSKKFSISYKL